MLKKSSLAAPLLVLALAGTASGAAQAQAAGSGWQFEAAVYGWFPAITGDTSFPDGGSSIDLSTDDVLDALKFAFFTAFQARNGDWGVFTDIAYADLGGSKSGSRDFTVGGGHLPPVNVTANLDLDIKTWIWTIAGTYRLKNDDVASVDLLFGARMIDMTNRLSWSLNGSAGNISQSGTSEVGATNWDGVVGLKGRAYLGQDRKWFVPYYADVGTGESKLTWQVNAGVGYQFDWGALIASWRYLYYEFKSGSAIEDQGFSGPLIGVVVSF